MIAIDTIVQGDCLEVMKGIEDNSIDLVLTDPPYGYGFMGKDWDKAVIGVDVWSECLRILKPGAFAFIMSSPRQDVLSRMIVNLEDAGFVVGFTSIYWCYASGFPKAGNISKMVDKRLGAEREVVGKAIRIGDKKSYPKNVSTENPNKMMTYQDMQMITIPSTPEAKALDGPYGGFQPKPAVEVVLVVMKPLAEKTYVDQALANGHGVTWLDDGRIPCDNKDKGSLDRTPSPLKQGAISYLRDDLPLYGGTEHPQGRFPANLLVSDDVLNDGAISKSQAGTRHNNTLSYEGRGLGICDAEAPYSDTGSFSRYFDLDAWWGERIKLLPESVQKTFPFIIVPKASKSEKNKGCEGLEERHTQSLKFNEDDSFKNRRSNNVINNNHHPTVKPIKLFSYLITLGSREGDLIVDPFVGSGTSCISAKILGRHWIGIERESEYVTIADKRLEAEKQQMEFSLAGG